MPFDLGSGISFPVVLNGALKRNEFLMYKRGR
jgi:hypothetical protein